MAEEKRALMRTRGRIHQSIWVHQGMRELCASRWTCCSRSAWMRGSLSTPGRRVVVTGSAGFPCAGLRRGWTSSGEAGGGDALRGRPVRGLEAELDLVGGDGGALDLAPVDQGDRVVVGDRARP